MDNQNVYAVVKHLLKSDKFTFQAKKSGNKYQVNVDEISLDSIAIMLVYGMKRKFNDAKNSLQHRDKSADPKKLEEMVLDRIMHGELGTASIASTLSKRDQRIQDLAVEKMTQAGVTKKSILVARKAGHSLESIAANFMQQLHSIEKDAAAKRASTFINSIEKEIDRQLAEEDKAQISF